MLTTEFRLDSPILREALAEVPSVRATVEEYYDREDTLRLLFWVEGGDYARFEEASRADPTVAELVCLADGEDRRLYRADYTVEGVRAATFPCWSELGLVMFDLEWTDENWRFRMGFPDRDALFRYRQICRNRDLRVDLRTIRERTDGIVGNSRALTPRQREALDTAFDEGYYEVPREISLTELAEELGVSRQAASERLRRGTATLLEDALA